MKEREEKYCQLADKLSSKGGPADQVLVTEKAIAECRRAEERLRAYEHRFRAAFTTGLDAVCIATREAGRILEVNDQFEKLFGYPVKEVIGKTTLELDLYRNPLDRARIVSEIEVHGNIRNFITEAKRKDGQTRIVSLSISPIGDEPHVLGVIRDIDITKRRTAAEDLLESEKRYRGLFETLPGGFALVGMNKCFIEANASLRTMVGYTQEELRRLSYEDLTPKKWHAFEGGIVERQVLRRGYSDVYEKEYVRKDGTVFPVEVRAHLLRDGRGNPIEMWAFVRDVTRRKRSEETLKETEEQYRTVVQLSPAGILIHVDGKIQFTNPALGRMLGVGSQKELRGRPIRAFVHPDYRDLEEERIRRITLDGKRAPLVEEKFLRADRTAIDVEVTSFPFKYQGRDAIMAVVEDITPRKRAEEALRCTERELEEKSVNLEDANTALKVVLRHREGDKRTLESAILANIKELVFPYIERLRSRNLTKDQMTCLGMIESNLNEVISPFLRKIAAIYANFTPMETQIANLIKNGRTDKEIAEILKVGTGTVHTHRNNIRSKLGVRNKDVNLRSYLLSLQE